jgi:predicted nucleic acid-binding protein
LNVYADSSFLVSSCILDAHIIETTRRMAQHPQVWVTPLHRAEVANAIHRYVFRKAISPSDALAAWANFKRDCASGVWSEVDLPHRLWDVSIDLARQYGSSLGVRTLDSLHVACALELKAQRFWTFDDRQARLAEAVGLDTSA